MTTLFVITLLVLTGLIGLLGYSIRVPERRIWPPRQMQTWQYSLVWTLTLLAFGFILLLGLLDWNSLDWPIGWRWSVGLTTIVVGNGLAWSGVWQLGWKSTSGAKDKLITNGLYAYTRNPQYLGDMLILIGWAILSASGLIIVAVLLGLIAFILVPFAEEPWLEENYGSVYQQYKNTTPRFIVI